MWNTLFNGKSKRRIQISWAQIAQISCLCPVLNLVHFPLEVQLTKTTVTSILRCSFTLIQMPSSHALHLILLFSTFLKHSHNLYIQQDSLEGMIFTQEMWVPSLNNYPNTLCQCSRFMGSNIWKLLARSILGFTLHLLFTTWKDALQWVFS